MNTDYILMFIDYLLIPAIALAIELKRSGRETGMSLKVFLSYASYTVAIAVICYIIRVVLSRIGITMATDAGTGIYTIMATFIALILPYIREIFTTYVNVRCEIKGKKDSTSVDGQ